MSSTKVKACSTLNEMNPEQDNIDCLIRQAIEKEPFLSFSRVADRPIQLIQLLNAFEQQGCDKLSNCSKRDSFDMKENSENIFYSNSYTSELNGIKDHVHSKGSMSSAKGAKCTTSQMPSRKIPEAVVAFAQAAAKATGEPEKSDLPGWPLLSPSKAQLQTCDKCSREFCSSINYRRHRRVHRRSLNVDKDSTKNRDFLGTFWDKLSADEAKRLVSLKNVAMEEVTGSSIIKALSTWFRRPGMLSSLPQVYIKAGSTLLDVVQANPSTFPISSQDLFSVLDEASEKTFLCAGTALSLQKYIFDVEAVKRALEIKNIVACTSFLIEIELVKAWLVDKDAEALRCQKLLVDEEEAAQKRQAEVLERKRLKKIRQKEQKVKEICSGEEKVDFKFPSIDSPPDLTRHADTASPSGLSEDNSFELSQCQEQQFFDYEDSSSAAEDDMNAEKSRTCHKQTENHCSGHYGKISELPFHPDEVEQEKTCRVQRASGYMKQSYSRNVNSKLSQNSLHGLQAVHSSAAKPLVNTRESNTRDSKVINRANGRKVWTIKSKPGDEEYGRYDRDTTNIEVLIGSINVSLGAGELHLPSTILEPQSEEKPVKPDSTLSSLSRTTMKLWRPVSRHGNGVGDVKGDVCVTSAVECSSPPHDRCLSLGETVSDSERRRGAMMFSSKVAKAFLAQRWKEAISRDEVVVISSPETEASGSFDGIEGVLANSSPRASDFDGRHVLGRVENRMLQVVGALDSSASQFKFRPKAEKNTRLKYVPKQKSVGAGE